MKKDELQKKISQQWGALSEEASTYRDISKKAIKWERYEFEKYALGKPDDKKTTQHERTNPQPADHKPSIALPKETDIFKATWAYFMARAAFIFMMWIILFIVMALFFFGMWASIDLPSWEDVHQRRGHEQHRILR